MNNESYDISGKSMFTNIVFSSFRRIAKQARFALPLTARVAATRYEFHKFRYGWLLIYRLFNKRHCANIFYDTSSGCRKFKAYARILKIRPCALFFFSLFFFMDFTIPTNAHRPTKILSHSGCFSITRGILSPSFHFIQIHPFAACTTTHGLAGFSACGLRKSAHPAGRARSRAFLPSLSFCGLADRVKNRQ